MIRAIFFDYDGVLTTDKTGSLTTNRYLSKSTGIDHELIREAFLKYNKDLNTGKIAHSEILEDLCTALNCEISQDLLRRAFESTPMNDGMFRLARKLRETYRLGIITDNKKDRMDHLRRFQELESLFDPIVVSSEVGSSKESSEIFKHALGCLKICAKDSIFIDNNMKNLVVPNALGMNTVFYDDERNDIEELISILKGKFGIGVGHDA
jgi:HAD superfamily hydrolase (TIGR01549 family)